MALELGAPTGLRGRVLAKLGRMQAAGGVNLMRSPDRTFYNYNDATGRNATAIADYGQAYFGLGSIFCGYSSTKRKELADNAIFAAVIRAHLTINLPKHEISPPKTDYLPVGFGPNKPLANTFPSLTHDKLFIKIEAIEEQEAQESLRLFRVFLDYMENNQPTTEANPGMGAKSPSIFPKPIKETSFPKFELKSPEYPRLDLPKPTLKIFDYKSEISFFTPDELAKRFDGISILIKDALSGPKK
jgi:hypothetical protein